MMKIKKNPRVTVKSLRPNYHGETGKQTGFSRFKAKPTFYYEYQRKCNKIQNSTDKTKACEPNYVIFSLPETEQVSYGGSWECAS